MSKAKTINHIRFGEIRIINRNNSIRFVADDIAKALEYKYPRIAIANYCKNISKQAICSENGEGVATIIPEIDVYRLIMHSPSSETKRFQNWLNDCISPALFQEEIDKDMQELEDIFSDPDTIIRLATHLKKEQQKRKEEERINKENFPKILFAASVESSHKSILIRELAKILRQNGVKIGQNKLFQWFRNNHYLCKSGERYNRPTQRAMDMGLSARTMEFELYKKQIEYLQNRLEARDNKVDFLYKEIRDKEDQVLRLTAENNALELKAQESDMWRCNILDCDHRIPPKNFKRLNNL